MRKLLHSTPDPVSARQAAGNRSETQTSRRGGQQKEMESSTKGAGNAKAKQNGGSAWGKSQAHGRFSVAGGIHHPSSVPGAGTVKANRSVGRGKQKQVGALYNWEKEQDGGDHGGGCSLDSPGSSSAGIQDMVANLQQAATNEPGHYVVSNQDNSQYDQNPVSRGIFDLQVLLTPDEYRSLQAKVRAKRAEDKHALRAKQAMKKPDNADYLFSSSPYIDKNRVEEAMFRSPNKDKWITDTGFQRHDKTRGKTLVKR